MAKAFGPTPPPGLNEILMGSISRMRPWIVMTQIAQLDYVADMMAGRQPLDMMLSDIAAGARKEIRGLENMDEQFGIFESLTTEEQIKLLTSAVEHVENPSPEKSSVRQIVDLYLAGELEALADVLNKQEAKDEALRQKLMKKLFEDRNMKMADRIMAARDTSPALSYFFAVGAGHYAGETGLIALLTKKGLKITRLSPADAAAITRRPAA
jgi:uncharacterized protein YbaP (TraB family)